MNGGLREGREVTCRTGAVAAEPAGAARVGAEVLRAGGNAMDAAAAACLASCVLAPETADLGGYVLSAVVREASGRVWAVDANSVAPAAASESMFRTLPLSGLETGINANEYACRVQDDANVYGPLAVGVPGVMAGIGTLWERWGRLGWEQIVAPSQRLVEDGFPYGPTAGAIRMKEQVILRFEASARHLMPGGRLPEATDTWRRNDLEKTLARLAAAGWRDFYEGDLGRQIADCVSGMGGILTREDMSAFRPRVEEPYRSTYRDAELFAARLPNGGITVLQILNMLECFDPVSEDSPLYWHRFAEVLKIAWRERLRHLGDPDFGGAPAERAVPVERFLDKKDAAGKTARLRREPEWVDHTPWPSAPQDGGTVQVSAVDAAGNLAAATFSHGGLFGSCVTVPGAGFTLGHGMCRFDPRPGRVNSAGPRKRPLNNIAPTILRMPDRWVATGLRGGRRILSVCAQMCQRFVDSGLSSLGAASAPRIHVETQEPVELQDSLDPRIHAALAAMGHQINPAAEIGASAHTAELLAAGSVRAGGNVWAAGL